MHDDILLPSTPMFFFLIVRILYFIAPSLPKPVPFVCYLPESSWFFILANINSASKFVSDVGLNFFRLSWWLFSRFGRALSFPDGWRDVPSASRMKIYIRAFLHWTFLPRKFYVFVFLACPISKLVFHKNNFHSPLVFVHLHNHTSYWYEVLYQD